MAKTKALPAPSLKLLLFPATDTEYVHFEDWKEQPFDHDAVAFSRRNAWWLADAALLAYWPPDQVPATFARAGLVHTQFFASGSTQCYVASNDRFALVAFRGTQINEAEDLLADAEFKLVASEGGGRVHHGFLSALDAVWAPLSTHLQALTGRSIWFGGHSLGAALATLAADRWQHGDFRGGVYTVGSPRVGDAQFAARFDATFTSRCFRYVNGRDSVPTVPPVVANYAHVGEERVLKSEPAGHLFLAGLEAPLIDHTPRRYSTLIWNELATG